MSGELAKQAREASRSLLSIGTAEKRNILKSIQSLLVQRQSLIEAANQQDISNAKDLSSAMQQRLLLTPSKFTSLLEGLEALSQTPDPIGQCTLARQVTQGLSLYRTTCPVGVLLLIFEARPEVIVQISSLALYASNAVLMKGGKEAFATNTALVSVIQEALALHQLPATIVQYISSREQVHELLVASPREIDLVVPRGSRQLVEYVQSTTRLPVLGHADGLCSIYVHSDADPQMVERVILDSKTTYPAACNSVETVLVHESYPFLDRLIQALIQSKVTIHAAANVQSSISSEYFIPAQESDFYTEFLSLDLAMKCDPSLDAALLHIAEHGSRHTDAILTMNASIAEQFMQQVDSAGVYWNASTRFADGFRYGFGAEIGVSTNKTHARGPVGVEGLVIYKYRLIGNGNITQDCVYNHQDLPIAKDQFVLP